MVRKSKQDVLLDKLLGEFPWLWRMSPVWDPYSDKIIVKHATEQSLSDLKFDLKFDESAWVKHRNAYSMISVIPSNRGYGLIATGAHKVTEPCFSRIEAIILFQQEPLHQGTDRLRRIVTIYLGKKKFDLDMLCEKIARQNPVPERKPLSWETKELLANDGL